MASHDHHAAGADVAARTPAAAGAGGEADAAQAAQAVRAAEELAMPFGEQYAADPAQVWLPLLAAGPVHRVATPDGPPAWVVTTYPEVHAGLLDPRLSVCTAHARGGDYKGFALPPALQAHLLNREPPDHTWLRALVAPAMSPQRIEQLRPAVQARVDDLVAPISAAGHGDLVAELAVPLPLLVVCDLLGVPADARAQLLEWAGRLLAVEPAQVPRARDTLAGMLRIIAGIVDAKRRTPGEDLLTVLIQAHERGPAPATDGNPDSNGDGDGGLSGDELTSMIFYLLFVWYEPSVDLLSNGVLTLLRHPDQLALLRRQPDLIPAAVEELLRHETPQALAAPRFPIEDVEIADTRIPAGDTVLLSLAAANLDPARFPTGAAIAVEHATRAHLAFGQGVHTCLGAPLVRLQTELAIATLLRRCPELRLAIEPPALRWRHGLRHRGLRELPITCSPACGPDP